jgi:methionyl-tRNA synthetase
MEQVFLQNQWLLFLVALWTLPWKGWALWRAARLGQKKWFIVILVVNTLGVLEILYIYLFSRKKEVEATKTE